jgi:hypothetical protein
LATNALVLFRDERLIGPAIPGTKPATLVVAPPEWTEQQVSAARFHVVAASVDKLERPFKHYQGHMYAMSRPKLKHVADDVMPNHDSSPIFIFEDKRQLESPHSMHADIVKLGAGRFSHWGEELLFSSSDNSDPQSNNRTYEIVVVESE